MARDYAAIVAALRAKADAEGATSGEAKALRDKADALEAEHGPFDAPKPYTFCGVPMSRPPFFASTWYGYDDWLDTIVDDDYLYDE